MHRQQNELTDDLLLQGHGGEEDAAVGRLCCARARARACVCVCVCACVRASQYVCMCACVCMCARAYMFAGMCVCLRAGEPRAPGFVRVWCLIKITVLINLLYVFIC